MLNHLRRLLVARGARHPPLAPLRRQSNATSSSSSSSSSASGNGGKDGNVPLGKVSRSSLDSAVNMDAHTHLDVHQVG